MVAKPTNPPVEAVMLVDLHVHSNRTPGCALEAKEALARAEALGLDGICFTDLDTLEGVAELHALREATKVAVLVGMEAATDHGRLLCFFPAPERVSLKEILGDAEANARPARDVVEAVLARGGAVIAAQPYDRDLEKPMGDFLFTLRDLTAVEGYVGRMRTNVNELAMQAANHLSLPCVGGSGALGSYEEIGTAATLFRDEFRDEAGLVAALRSGAVWSVVIGEPPHFHGDDVVASEPRDRFPQEDRGGRSGSRDGRRDGRRGGGRHRSGGAPRGKR